MAKASKKDKALTVKGAAGEIQVGDYADYEGGGFENQTAADLAIPFLAILQGLSPQVKEVDQGGIEGARPGMIFNTVTEEMKPGKEGVLFVPAMTQHVFVEWVPRDAGGGFVAVHDPQSEIVTAAKSDAEEFGKYKVGENDLVETFYVYGVAVSEDPEGPAELAILAFTSTKIKIYKRWNTKLSMFTLPKKGGGKMRPPMFAHLTRVSSSFEKNNKGEFYNIVMAPANGDVKSSLLAPTDPRFEAAVNCKDMVDRGDARASYETQNAGGGEGEGEDPPF